MVADILFHQLTLCSLSSVHVETWVYFTEWTMVVQNLYKGSTIIRQAKDLPTLHQPELAHNVAVKVIHHVAHCTSITKLADPVLLRAWHIWSTRSPPGPTDIKPHTHLRRARVNAFMISHFPTFGISFGQAQKTKFRATPLCCSTMPSAATFQNEARSEFRGSPWDYHSPNEIHQRNSVE